MFNGIPVNSGLFEQPVIEEINNAFSNIQDSIEALEVKPLRYKYPCNLFSVRQANDSISINNRSYRIGNEIILDLSLYFKEDTVIPLYGSLEIAKTEVNNPYRYYGKICEANHLKNNRYYWNEQTIIIAGSSDDTDGTKFLKDREYIIQGHIII